MKFLSIGLFIGLALLECFIADAGAAVPRSTLEARLVGQLQPSGLPSGVTFGGGGNSFERRVDVAGSLAVVGAGVFRQGSDQGRAFLYDFSDPNNIEQVAVLRPSDNSAGNEFGDGVAISGNYVFVSAWGDAESRGSVYMYDVSDPNNIIERRITAFDTAPRNYFGFSLSVDGNRLFVGAPKFSLSTLPPAAYIIDFSDPDNLKQTKVVQSNIGAGGNYAEAVAISGNYAIVGHISDSTEFPFGGSAHLYDISNLSAIRSKRLTPTDAPNYSAFGQRVAISGTKALVSVSSDPGPTNNAGTRDGAVWAFDFSDWNSVVQHEYGRPVPTFGGPVPPFGRFLDLQGDLAYAGAFNEDSSRGALYIHDVSNVLSPVELLRLPARANSDMRFGTSFAVDGRMLIVSDQAGQVYLYQLVPEPTNMLLAVIAFGTVSLLRIWLRYR
jgi:hypothetical protein